MKTHKSKLICVTPKAEELLLYMARVSNPAQQDSNNPKLIKYLIDHHHWSPFEMVSACVELNITRDIGRQILRHRSFSFQEFSQRYANIKDLPQCDLKEARLQDSKNRQNSIEIDDPDLEIWWYNQQERIRGDALSVYHEATQKGIAKEVARVVLPEGLTMSRMYMTGTLRSWIHYLQVRLDPGTQKEHREVAQEIKELLLPHFPNTFQSLESLK